MKKTVILFVSLMTILSGKTLLAQCFANAGPDTINCGPTITLHGSSSGTPGSTVLWTTAYPGAVFSDPDSVITELTIPNWAGGSVQVQVTLAEENAGVPCTDSDMMNVDFRRLPHVESGAPQVICGATTMMYADTIGSGLIDGYWTCSDPEIQLDYSGPWSNHFACSIDASGSSILPLNGELEINLVYHATNGICWDTDSVQVFFFSVPAAFAGEDDTVCGKTYTLQAVYSLPSANGTWSVISKPFSWSTASFTPAGSNNANVTVSDYGVYQFSWRERNAANLGCYDTDTVAIEFLAVPHPDAGLDTSVCGKWVHLQAQMNGGVTGTWSSTINAWYDAQNGTFCPACAENADVWAYYSSENDTVTYYWTEFNGVCYGYDSVNVYFGSIQQAVALVDVEDSTACGRIFTELNAIPPAYGTGYWVDSVPNTIYDPAPTSPTPNTATIGVGTYGMHYFYWITTNGNCRDTSAIVPVNFIEQPEADAGGNYWPGLFGPNSDIKTDTVCGLSYQLWATPSVGSGLWFAIDYTNVMFEETGNATPSPDPHDSLYILGFGNYSVFNTTKPYREFYWQEIHQGVCTDNDTLRIYFAPRPTGEFSILPFACADSQLVIANTWPYPNDVDYGVTTFNWSFPGLICNAGNLNQDTLILVTPDNLPHNVSLITENQWGCISGIYFQTVYPAGIYSPVNGSLTGTIPEPNSILVAGYDAVTKEMIESTHPNSSGAYSLFLPYGHNYYVKALNEDGLENPGIASTYYGDSWTWDHAQLVQPVACDVTIANITMLTFTPANNGNCRVFGKVVYDSGDPVKDINVYLQYNTIYTLAGMTNTNYMGQYELSGCEPGSYALYIDIPALPMVTTHHFTILAGDTVVPNLNFIVDTTATKDYGFGIYADTTSGVTELPTGLSAFRVYPNPASDYIVVESTEPGSEPVLCTLFDSKGVLLLQRELEPQTSSVLEEIAALMPGVYYVRLISGNTIYVKKIIRE